MPLLTGLHLNNYTIYNRGTPVRDRWMTDGPGREYLDAYGPVGVRDTSSLEFLREHGVDAYFSGCITLTLPQQKKTEDAGEYIVIADLGTGRVQRKTGETQGRAEQKQGRVE